MILSSGAIAYSSKDYCKGITLPSILTPELAEIIGIILGDGHLDHKRIHSNGIEYRLMIAGSAIEDVEYYEN